MKRTGNGRNASTEIGTRPQFRGRGRPPGAPKAPSTQGKGKGEPKILDIRKLRVRPKLLELTIAGTSDLIVHKFSAKAQKKILDKQMGVATPAPKKKDPFEEFVDSLYIIDDAKIRRLPRISAGQTWPYVKGAFGFPASAFKQVMVGCCKHVDGIAPATVKAAVHVMGELVPIQYEDLIMRQDTVNNKTRFGRKIADIRFRGAFQEWEMDLEISYDERLITMEQVALLIANGGYYIGIGENRPGSPEKPGNHGMFAIGD